MDTRTVGALRILTPDLDPRDLDPIAEPPDEDLTEAMVDGEAWPGLHLIGARISRCHLLGVDLREAAWRNVTLYGCRLERVDLSNARLTGVTVERCEFRGCRMTGVQLSECTLKNVTFDDCRLDYANLEKVSTRGPAAWVGCVLTDATLTACGLGSAAFDDCRTADVRLTDCDLRGADLRGAGLSGLTGLASLVGATIDAGQMLDLATLAARDLGLTVRD